MSSGRDQFSAWAEQYDDALHRGLSLSGERKEYFARGRIRWLKSQLDARHFYPKSILDFGCGTGTSTPLLQEMFEAQEVLGVDVSDRSLEVARERNPGRGVVYENSLDREPAPRFDLAFCNGVFHHIPPAQRSQALSYIWQSLVPGGWLLTMTPAVCDDDGRCGRGAYQDPTHVSFWSSNNAWYFTKKTHAKFVPEIRCRFQSVRLSNGYPSEWHREHLIPYVVWDAAALKPGVYWPGPVEI